MENQGCHQIQFRFADSQQQRIYEDLQLVGQGPAAFFRDACWLMHNKGALESTSHLVAHLLREIESALRSALRPLATEAPDHNADARSRKEDQKENQKEHIRVIIQALGIPEDTPEAHAWFELVDKLHGFAHRSGLGAPRPPAKVHELWEQAQVLLFKVLAGMRDRFLHWLRILDDLLTRPCPTNDDLKRLANEVPSNPVTHGYFFDRLDKPEWLERLWEKGFFRHPPVPVLDEEQGIIRFPSWSEARYLTRMAPHKPGLVVKIIQEMDDTDNAAVLSDLLDALLALPPIVSVQLVEKAAQWVKRPYWLRLDKLKLGQLMGHWAKGGLIEEALHMARVLLDILPDERRVGTGPDEEYRPPAEPRAHLDAWEYEKTLKKHYPELARAAGLPALEVLCDLLDRAIRLSQHYDDDQGPEDYSVRWRPAVEDHPQNNGHTLKDALVTAIRDAAELVVRSRARGTVEEVVNALERRPWRVLRRIALHVLQVFADQSLPLIATRLTDRSLLDDVGAQHEYVLLLRDCFQRLTPENQATILEWIKVGPDVEKFKRRQEEVMGSSPSDDDIARYRESWQRDWLARIGHEILPRKWQERYRELVGKYGEPDHVEFPTYTEIVWGPTSPKSADELKAMSVQEIVEFLKMWRPPDNAFHEPSPEGLGRVLSSVVAQDPGPFVVEAKRFHGLDPTYIRAVLFGLREALEQGGSFDWEPVLDICGWALSQPRETPGRQVGEKMTVDPDWGSTREAIANLLSAGFGDGLGTIPIHLREKVWPILKPLTEDPDPTPEHEERYGGSNTDPATHSINTTTRGAAMHAVVRYALWVRRHMEGQADTEDQPRRDFDEMPEVREVLDARLDVAQEPSPAIRAVYGQWFPELVLLDSKWARDNAARIFPIGQGEEALFEAAWDTYVTFCWPYDNVLDILREQYRHAVERLSCRHDGNRRLPNPDEKLAEHLMVFYWRGKLSLEDPLFTAFWERATDTLRAHAFRYVGRELERASEKIPEEVLDRLTQLWAVRLAWAKQSQSPTDFTKEMAAFGWWFVSDKFDVAWAIAQLSESFQLVRQTEPEYMVLEQLARTAATHPVESTRCLRIIAEWDRKGGTLTAGLDHVRKILEMALRNPTVGKEVERIIHHLGSHGYLEFRNLLEDDHRG